MNEFRTNLETVADVISKYRETLPTQRVGAEATRPEIVASLPAELPEEPTSVDQVIRELVSAAGPGLVSTTGPRYFGFVTGGSLDAALLADLLTVGWDQVGFNEALSPAALAFEDIAGSWIKQVLGLPQSASVGFTTGAQGANTVSLASGRWKVLRDHGWDVGKEGLNGGPPVRVVVGAERHATIDRSVRLLGLGESAIEEVPVRSDGAMDADALGLVLGDRPKGPVIVCAQAGNVNTGAFDDLEKVTTVAREHGAWVHVDGAFGLWAGASPGTKHLVNGIENADSWALDGHKWLNVPYDSGYAVCAHPDVHATAMAYTASYLTGQVADRVFGGGDYVPESSRRARGFATWAAMRSLGRSGIAELVERCCTLARRLASGLDALGGTEVVNDVVLNQVLVRVGDSETTDRVAGRVQEEGTAWLGATTWRGERLLRISVSNWSTSEADVDLTVAAIEQARIDVTGG